MYLFEMHSIVVTIQEDQSGSCWLARGLSALKVTCEQRGLSALKVTCERVVCQRQSPHVSKGCGSAGGGRYNGAAHSNNAPEAA